MPRHFPTNPRPPTGMNPDPDTEGRTVGICHSVSGRRGPSPPKRVGEARPRGRGPTPITWGRPWATLPSSARPWAPGRGPSRSLVASVEVGVGSAGLAASGAGAGAGVGTVRSRCRSGVVLVGGSIFFSSMGGLQPDQGGGQQGGDGDGPGAQGVLLHDDLLSGRELSKTTPGIYANSPPNVGPQYRPVVGAFALRLVLIRPRHRPRIRPELVGGGRRPGRCAPRRSWPRRGPGR